MADRDFLIKLQRKLVDDGLLIEAGWVGLRIAAVPPSAPAIQIEEMRQAFFAGAQHLLSAIMMIMEPGAEPTNKDMERMSLINDELDRFIIDFEKRHGVKPPATEH